MSFPVCLGAATAKIIEEVGDGAIRATDTGRALLAVMYAASAEAAAELWSAHRDTVAELNELAGRLVVAAAATGGDAYAALIAQILDLLAGNRPAPPPARPRAPREPLTKSEMRVLRYLPTHLTAAEIASELYISTTTVKTHLRNLYAKLSAHSRAEAVQSARALGLLAPSARSPAPA